MTKEEVIKRLTEFNVDPRNTRLREYYDADNMWKTLRIERDENKHSDFLAWILGKDATESNSFLHRFLNLLVFRAKNNDQMENVLRDSILMQKLKVQRVKEITREKTISSLSVISDVDRIDIYMDCEIGGCQDSNLNSYNSLEIIIENKVGASEGGPKGICDPQSQNPNEIYKGKTQTQRYYYACSKEREEGHDNILRKAPFDPARTQQLFVYLTPKEEEPQDDHFIKISYQDLVDYVLERYFEQKHKDENIETTLKDYLKNLGNPMSGKDIMALDPYQRQLLVDFYKRNEDLFRSALSAMIADENTSEADKDEFEQTLKTLQNTTKNRNQRFTKNGAGCYKMYEVLAEFVKFRVTVGSCTIEELNKEINDYIFKGESTRVNVSLADGGAFCSKKGQYSDKLDDGTPFYLTTQWSNNGQNPNFKMFMDGVSKKYGEDFKIELIDDEDPK